MNCPKCGLQTLPDQKFCRSCGTGLQMITHPLAELTTVSDLKKMSAINLNHEKPRANRVVQWGFIMMFIGAAIGVVGKKLMHEDIVTVIGILISLAGMFLTAYPFLSPSRPAKYDSNPSSQPEVLTPPQPTEYLPEGSNTEFVPSITERTTDLLKNSEATRLSKKEDGESQA